jgi:hypothetical protein
MSTLRLANLYGLARDRYPGGSLPDDKVGRTFLRVIFNYLAGAKDPARSMTSVAASWARWLDADELERLIDEAVTKPRKYRADRLAQMLGVDFATRQRLGLWSIGAIDLDAEQRRQRRKDLARRRAEQHRRARGIGARVRTEY